MDATVTVRPVTGADVPAVVAMVHELAAYEQAPEQCTLTVAQLETALFGADAAVFGHVAVDPSGEPVGFALWFRNFSTWTGSHGIFLEDLYVRPHARGTGAGRALLSALAAICVERGYPRFEWSVLDWNPARDFYHRVGAAPIDGWVPYRIGGAALHELAAAREPAAPAT